MGIHSHTAPDEMSFLLLPALLLCDGPGPAEEARNHATLSHVWVVGGVLQVAVCICGFPTHTKINHPFISTLTSFPCSWSVPH